MDGNISLSDLMRLFSKKGEDKFSDTLESNYQLDGVDAMKISDQINQLIQLKSQHESLFEEYSISDLIDTSSSQQQQPISSSLPSPPTNNNNSSTFQHLTFTPSLEDQIMGNPSGRSFITSAHISLINQDVIVKISSNISNLQNEHENLSQLNQFIQSNNNLQHHVIGVYGELLENITTHPSTHEPLHGIVLEKGGENMEEYLKNEPNLSDNDKISLCEKVIDCVRLIHSCGLVWMDCKLSNMVRFFRSPDWRGLDFEHSLRGGASISSNHGFTPLYAPPELMRYLRRGEVRDDGEERKGGDSSFQSQSTLTASKSMDMWSVGVCILEIITREDLVTLLGMNSNEELETFYCEGSDEEIEGKLSSLLDGLLVGEENRYLMKLLGKLLILTPSTRPSSTSVKNDPFISHKKGKTTIASQKAVLKVNERLEGIQEDISQINHQLTSSRERVDELLREVQGTLSTLSVDEVVKYGSISQSISTCNDEGTMEEYEEELKAILGKK